MRDRERHGHASRERRKSPFKDHDSRKFFAREDMQRWFSQVRTRSAKLSSTSLD